MRTRGQSPASADRRRRRLIRELVRAELLGDPRWRVAFLQVPRHVFVPRFFRARPDGRWVAVDDNDPDWLSYVYADTVLVTQLDDDPNRWAVAREEGPVSGVPTSSSSQPAIMAVMLTELHVADGQRVLEVGTGTGYNAALLCHGLGDTAVTTVDIDPDLVAAAAANLAEVGYHPTMAVGDGTHGYAANAPYDRVIATCSVSRIPSAWLDQTVPGGMVLTTLNRPIGAGLVRLTVGRDATAVGRVLPADGRFMPLRAHRHPVRHTVGEPDDGETRETTLDPVRLLTAASPFEFFAGLALPEVQVQHGAGANNRAVRLSHPDGSWAHVGTIRDRHVVRQGGPRPLWDLVERAYRQWLALDQPRRQRFGVTVRGDRQEIWLDEEDSAHRWPLD